MMKLIIAVLHHTDGEETLNALIDAGFRVTRMASSGGFLRRGNAAFLIGAPADQVASALQLIRQHSTPPLDPGLKRASVFVLSTDRYEQL
jgi:uncharacterized protein YaaQ